jgi:photosystem II stability/assembly factor-like uncharacterized protein
MKGLSMKTIFKIISTFVFLISFRLYAQEWIKVSPTFDPPGSYNTYIGSFADENHGWWRSGPNRYIWFTSDGGMHWSVQRQGGKAGSYIQFVDTLHGWFGGETLPEYKYYITTTKDGGKTWNEYSTPIILCITFFDSLNGFGGGDDSIYATTDGGKTWQPQSVDQGVRFGINDIYFIDRENGWTVGGSSSLIDAGIILNTTDGGKHWSVNEHPSGVLGRSVFFTDTLHGYVVGSNPPFSDGVIKSTDDGGVSWKTQYLPCTWLNDVVFTDDSTGWVVGDYGFIWHTTDRGINWIKVESGTTADLYRIFFFDNGKKGYIMGDSCTLLTYDGTDGVKEEQPPVALSFELFQNYPNPFNPMTQIEFQIVSPGFVSLVIYDLLGKEVITLLNEEKKSGTYTVKWNGEDNCGKKVSTGIYFYRLRSDISCKTRKMILIN